MGSGVTSINSFPLFNSTGGRTLPSLFQLRYVLCGSSGHDRNGTCFEVSKLFAVARLIKEHLGVATKEHFFIPHGGYTVPKSPIRYAHPAPSLDIRCLVTNAVPTAEHASDNLCGCARPYSRCLSNGNAPWYHTVDIPSLIHRPGTFTRPRHTIFVRRAALFLP